MNPTDPNSQPLVLQPWLWVGLAIVAVIGVSDRMRDHGEMRSHGPVVGDPQIIVRTSSPHHTFPILKLRVSLPEGWTYLSVADDAIADAPTFVNEAARAIVRLQPFRFRSWPPIEADIDSRQYASVAIEWIAWNRQWIGRLTQGQTDVTLVVQTHTDKFGLNQAVEEFCDSIEPIGTAD